MAYRATPLPPLVIRVKQLADLIGIHPKTLHLLLRKHGIAVRKWSGSRVILLADVPKVRMIFAREQREVIPLPVAITPPTAPVRPAEPPDAMRIHAAARALGVTRRSLVAVLKHLGIAPLRFAGRVYLSCADLAVVRDAMA